MWHFIQYLLTYIFTYLLTYSMVQSPSWEANWFAASQEIPRISRNPKVHYLTHKRPPPVSILGQPNPVHIPTSHLLEIRPNIIHPSTPRSPQWSTWVKYEYGVFMEWYWEGETDPLRVIEFFYICPSAISATTWTGLGSNTGLRDERLVTNYLSHGRALDEGQWSTEVSTLYSERKNPWKFWQEPGWAPESGWTL